ncbi:MAG: AraC family transcriptional regulator [Massiliimalia sp.]|jgi:two-component system response regulator YesN
MIKANKKLLSKIVLTFMSAVIVIILGMSTFFYSFFESKMQQQLYQDSLVRLRQTASTVEFLSEYVQSVFTGIINDPQIMDLSMTHEADGDDVRKGLSQLEQLRITTPQIYSIYIYNDVCNCVFSSGSNESSMINDIDFFYDAEYRDFINNIDNISLYTPYHRMIPVRDNYQTSIYTYFYYTKSITGKIRNIIAINFSGDWVKKSIGYLSSPDKSGSYIEIIDENNNIVLSQNILKQSSSKELNYYRTMIEENQQQGFFIYGDGKNKKLVSYVCPDRWGYDNWTFLSINDYDVIVQPIQSSRTVVIWSCIGILIVSCMVIWLLSNKIYRPIQNKIETLEYQQNKDYQLKRQYFLFRLLNNKNNENTSDVIAKFDKYKINFSHKGKIIVMIITVDNYWAFKNRPNHSVNRHIHNLELDIQQILQQRIENFEILPFSNGVIPVIIEVKDSVDIRCLGSEFQASLTSLQYAVSICFSSLGYTYRDLPFLYKEAMTAKSYVFVQGLHSVIYYDEYMEGKKYYIPNLPNIERDMINQIFSGKEEQAIEVLNCFFGELEKMDIDNIQLSFLHLAYAIKHYYQSNISFLVTTLDDFTSFIQKIQTLETIGQVKNMFINLFSEIHEGVLENAKSKHDNLVSTIRNSVEKNYSNPIFSINNIADEINMSSAYIGKLYKQAAGHSFTEYLNDYRLQKASCLLLSTNETVNKISESVGFSNSSYFFNMFKKKYNMTPAAYRAANK